MIAKVAFSDYVNMERSQKRKTAAKSQLVINCRWVQVETVSPTNGKKSSRNKHRWSKLNIAIILPLGIFTKHH